MEKAKTEKKSTRTGKAIGKRNRATVSIAINDESREVSHLLEIVKKYYSNKKITAAEAYRSVVMRGITCVLEDITLSNMKQEETERNILQQHLF